MLRVRYGQVSGDISSFGTAPRAQARACLSTGARVTVVLMTFSVLAQGGGAGVAKKQELVAEAIQAIQQKEAEGY